ncbi:MULTISPECIES: RNA degradosome polyphosphate kinase [Caproicibacterium]|jgi:polyphosphate kinase|uniref:Polyphosphate kinase n=1 Tax=Caproicibacterium lactatifermentans TaxID=2666138 RepID=A0A859DPY1_9FIRM|nr:RNA degradosome polyphosphate kinase [Caproicibacterium lactatifermentans]ARP50679.1 RNA degradosome polyphosphate kinase [Ruminococcaceae bacterium CPB6]MDD4808118.1 RNA degradosome polyphosphate kinase [Oscillospiraceae bacterium]QKN23589.1 RNA degradosome polyphosphate kinase [Caproicibacterium lactatifermentans]QKO29735.1 RNA degradosome polyphosphate kinase [Caproicibacterium lactatifermentans]
MNDKSAVKTESQPMPYYNRELSWMDFNARVLEECFEKENPIMERVRFLSITASNLDEFFMVRVAGVLDQINSKYHNPDPSGLTPKELYRTLSEKIHTFTDKQYSCLHRSILPALKKEGIRFLSPEEMDSDQLEYISEYFHKILFPVLTPLAVDRSRPFPFLSNKSLNIAVRLAGKEGEEDCFAVVQVPSILPRYLELPGKEGRCFVLLENAIMHGMEHLFEARDIRACCPFRITRDSDLDIDEESDDLLMEVQKSIKKRKRGAPVRLELLQKCDPAIRDFLLEMLDVDKHSIYELPGPLDLTFFSKFANLPGCENLCFKPIVPVYPPTDFWGYTDIFEAIRDKDRMVHHPYESFDIVVNFIRAAAEDENVLAIKQTLYRVSGHSPIIAALIKAAENGKQVTVLVELKARFDEENNINWAKKLEKAGCHVIYGLAGLKTHCKIALVVRREEDGIHRYLHMGTGNYNDSTAKIYTDIGLFTCKEPFGIDASSLFNVLTGYSRPPEYNKFLVAPHGLRSFFEYRIRCETENARQGLPSGITAKVNSLVDPAIISLLYKASQAGVPVQLIVRGICCLIPGIPGVSDNIQVISIVGQLLEHSRIFRFENAGDPKIYMGSADWMPRNLDRRVELVFPIEDPDLKQRSFDILDLMLHDNINARRMKSNKEYEHIDRRGKTACNCQIAFSQLARQAVHRLAEQDRSKPFHPLLSPAKTDG